MARCSQDPVHFMDGFCFLLDLAQEAWVPFHPWPAQIEFTRILQANDAVIALKARQLGFTADVIGFALWKMLFHPVSTILFFSKDDAAAKNLLRDRLKGMYQRLPDWMKPQGRCKVDNDHEWELPNGSKAQSFPTTGGRSYTASLVLIDEADHLDDLNAVLAAVEPTIKDGGKIILLSSVDKKKPQSAFKRLYRAAKEGQNSYTPVFYGWQSRPGRTQTWYEKEKQNIFSRTGALDLLHQEYPATDTESLAPNRLDKRIPFAWLQACYVPKEPLTAADLVAMGVSLEIPQAPLFFPPE